jgi:lipopolysaccharide assembly outer membrane protein LptD (OstA)
MRAAPRTPPGMRTVSFGVALLPVLLLALLAAPALPPAVPIAAAQGPPATAPDTAAAPDTTAPPPATAPDTATAPPPATAPDTAAALPDTLPANVNGNRLRQEIIDGVPVLVLDQVRVEHGPTTITADTGRYYRDRGQIAVDGNVRIVEREATITGKHGTYDVATGIATLTGDVEIQRGDLRIRGPRATYDRAAGIARLGGGVRVKDAARDVRADSLVYWAAEDRAMALGRVQIDEAGDRDAVIRGEVAEYKRREGDLQMLEKASVTFEDEGKPVEITAADFSFREQGKVVHARGNVVIKQKGAEAVAEDALFYQDDRRAVLTGSPVARDAHGEIQGDTLEVGFEKGEMRRLVSRGKARSIYGRDVSGGGREEIRLRGDTLVVEMSDGEARGIVAAGRAESLYLPAGESRRSGALQNLARADRIMVEMASGRAERVILVGGAEGEYRYREAARDTTGAASDTTATGAALPDTAGARPDTAAGAQPDTSGARPGTTGARPDTTGSGAGRAVADSLRAARTGADSLRADADSLAAPAEDSLARIDAGLEPLPPDSVLQVVHYQADRIEYFVEREEILLLNHANLTYGDLHLVAGEVRFSARDHTILATKSPELEDRSQKLHGDAMAYDFKTREGSVLEGSTTFDTAVYSGSRLFRSGEGVIHVKGANYTTCAVDPPHYHFAGDRMKVYLDDKVVTQPIGLFIRRVPILALPFYVFPIKRGRHSGLLFPQIEFGFSESRGRFIHNAGYYWVLNDYADLKLAGDFNELTPYFVGNAVLRYAQRYRLNGDFNFHFAQENNVQRFDLLGAHRHDLGSRRTLQLNANLLSNREFRREDQAPTTPGRLDSELNSNVTFTKSWSSQSLSLQASRNQNLQNLVGETQEGSGTITGNLPSLAYSFQNRPLGRLPDAKGRGARWPVLANTSYSFSGRYNRNYDNRREPDIYLQQVNAQGAIADRRRVGMFNIGPTFSINSSYDERTELPIDTLGVIRPEIGDIFTANMTTSMDAQTEAYGLFGGTLGPYRGFRHILTPRASVSYTKGYNSRFDVEGGPARSSVNLGLANRLETRIAAPGGQPGQLTGLRDFLTFNLSTTYDLSNSSDRRFTPIRGDARFRPGFGRDFEVNYQVTYDPYRKQNVNYSTSTRFTFIRAGRATAAADTATGGEGVGADDMLGEDLGGYEGVEDGRESGIAAVRRPTVAPDDIFPHAFTVSTTLSYVGGALASNSSLQAAVTSSFRATPKWRVDYSLRYDFIDREVVGQGYSLVRDLHCWEARFTRGMNRYSGGEDVWEYYFRIVVKDLPEIFYKRGRESDVGMPSFYDEF